MLGRLSLSALALLGAANAAPRIDVRQANSSALTNSATSLTLFFQNNLNATDDVNHFPFILLDPVSSGQAAAACAAIGESLVSQAQLDKYADDFRKSLAYLEYEDYHSDKFYVASGVLSVDDDDGCFKVKANGTSRAPLPVLCTDSLGSSSAKAGNQITVASGTNKYTGFRGTKSFNFFGVPFADKAARFTYSSVYSGQNQQLQTTAYSPQCAQSGSGSEDCLYLNINTPYLPKSGSKSGLKPVLLWIHGGGFTGGNGQTDGSALASREDIVFASIQYRLSTLGFLAVPGTNITGNYGISDQVTALKWVQQNIAAFGGDPKKVTIAGQSAGAGSVRVLLGSPPAIGNYRGAIAQSNLGGGVTLGLNSDYSTTYSSYLTISGSYAQSSALFTQAGCNQTDLNAAVACLKNVPALSLVGQSTVARYVVQDGVYVTTEQLIVNTRNASTAHVPVMFGVMADDGASFVNYPKTPVTSELAGLQSINYISQSYAQQVIDSGLFPFPNTGNLTLDTFNVSARLYTDAGFRCIDQATVYAGVLSSAFPTAYYYNFERSLAGYDPNNVGAAPPDATHPRGDPALPYFKVHSGELEFVFGTVNPNQVREPQDIYFAQLASGYWGSFTKSLNPNPSQDYLQTRGYTNTLVAVNKGGPWQAVGKGSTVGPIKRLNWPPITSPYLEVPQCAFLNYTLDYYINANRG